MNWAEKKIYIGSDHAALGLKETLIKFIKDKGFEIEDLGTHSEDSCDYPDYALKVAKKVAQEDARGILICGTGIGMSIAANKVKGIRAALVHNDVTAGMSRQHNNANILCIGARTNDESNAILMTKIWLETDFEGDRHQRRLSIITDYEGEN